MTLSERVVKKKKLQKHGGNSLVIIIPAPWIKDMDWTRETILTVSYNPSEKKILIEDKGDRFIGVDIAKESEEKAK